jgi:hypothetical protein
MTFRMYQNKTDIISQAIKAAVANPVKSLRSE